IEDKVNFRGQDSFASLNWGGLGGNRLELGNVALDSGPFFGIFGGEYWRFGITVKGEEVGAELRRYLSEVSFGKFVEELGISFVGQAIFAGVSWKAGVEVFVLQSESAGCRLLELGL